MIKVAVIWGWDKKEPVYSTHHHFFYETLKKRDDCIADRYTWHDWRTMTYDYDLYLFLDYNQDLFSLYDKDYHPRVFYWWDCAHNAPFSHQVQLTEIFDMSYFCQYAAAAYLQFQGLNVKWLPPSFDPEVYKPLTVEKKYDFTYVAQLDHVIRRKGLTRYDFVRKLLEDHTGFVSDDMISYNINKVMNQAKILFDRTTVINSIGTRFFEIIGSKGFCLMNKTKGNGVINQIATDGMHYVSYDDSWKDFIYKFKYYLDRPEERERIAEQGYKYFLDNHTYSHRIESIFRDFHLV